MRRRRRRCLLRCVAVGAADGSAGPALTLVRRAPHAEAERRGRWRSGILAALQPLPDAVPGDPGQQVSLHHQVPTLHRDLAVQIRYGSGSGSATRLPP